MSYQDSKTLGVLGSPLGKDQFRKWVVIVTRLDQRQGYQNSKGLIVYLS